MLKDKIHTEDTIIRVSKHQNIASTLIRQRQFRSEEGETTRYLE